jgi:hypothetical protein
MNIKAGILASLFITCGLSTPATLFATDFFQGEKQIFLIDQAGETTLIGSVEFLPDSEEGVYQFNLDRPKFQEHFLSMRPFQCLEHPQQMVCHLAYPYAIKRRIGQDELTDLEYDLLFLHKTPQEYGINAWNGLYYQLEFDDDRLKGSLQEVDLNILAVPPAEGELRPITDDMFYEAEDGKHAFPRIEIY